MQSGSHFGSREWALSTELSTASVDKESLEKSTAQTAESKFALMLVTAGFARYTSRPSIPSPRLFAHGQP